MEHTEQKQTNELKKSIAALMEDQDFVKRLAEIESTGDIQLLLKENGIEATTDQIEAIINDGSILGEKVIKENGELDTEALDAVAGGGPVGGLILAGIFLLGGTATRSRGDRKVIAAAVAFAIGCLAPCP